MASDAQVAQVGHGSPRGPGRVLSLSPTSEGQVEPAKWPGISPPSCPQSLAHQEEQARVVRQFHFHGWPEIGIPAEGKGMIDLITAVQKQQQQTGNHPITVHCR